jgi:broad specificity phosphatase PhoE
MSFNRMSGRTWEQHAAIGIYLAEYSDDDRFPDGESIKDLAVRARTALEKLVLPHVWQAAREGKTGIHVAVVSHGLCISELISELLNWDGKKGRNPGSEYSDIPNTGWHRVVIDIEVGSLEILWFVS